MYGKLERKDGCCADRGRDDGGGGVSVCGKGALLTCTSDTGNGEGLSGRGEVISGGREATSLGLGERLEGGEMGGVERADMVAIMRRVVVGGGWSKTRQQRP